MERQSNRQLHWLRIDCLSLPAPVTRLNHRNTMEREKLPGARIRMQVAARLERNAILH